MASILVVDDEAGMRELVIRQLGAYGHPAIGARTAEEALDRLVSTPDIDVVIADLQMPGHGGAWLVEQLVDRFPNVAVILATADAAVPGSLSLRPCVISYLVKPIAGEQLIAAVAEGLQWHDQRVQPPRDRASSADPVESWLDKKLIRGQGDGNNPDD